MTFFFFGSLIFESFELPKSQDTKNHDCLRRWESSAYLIGKLTGQQAGSVHCHQRANSLQYILTRFTRMCSKRGENLRKNGGEVSETSEWGKKIACFFRGFANFAYTRSIYKYMYTQLCYSIFQSFFFSNFLTIFKQKKSVATFPYDPSFLR